MHAADALRTAVRVAHHYRGCVVRGYTICSNGQRKALPLFGGVRALPAGSRCIGGFSGFGGGSGGRDTKYYDLLGISSDADKKEIKKAFRKAAMKHHPDQGGDMDKFKEIKQAYEVLVDEQKRAAYDQFGEAGVDESAGGGPGGFGGGGMDPNDIFSQFFGGQQAQRPQQPRKTDNINSAVQLTLEELYEGTTKSLAFNKTVLCGTCDGLGATSTKSIRTCTVCNGSGYVIRTQQMGPMLQQFQSVCTACGGEGKSIDPKDRCGTCHGAKVVSKRKELEVTIKPGLKHGQKLVLRGEADEAPNQEPGDIILTIHEKPHHTFSRSGKDLLYKHTLSLNEALTGYQIPLVLVCGKTRALKSVDGEVIAPGDLRVLKDAGMPLPGTQAKTKNDEKDPPRGDLFVQFDVDMPNSLTDEQRKLITEVFGEKKLSGSAKEYKQVTLEPVSKSRVKQSMSSGGSDYGGNGEEGSGCRQM